MDRATIFFTIFLSLLPIFIFLARGRRRSSNKLPPGSLGIPFIGQSFQLLGAMRANTAEEWLEKRIQKYGPISKLTLFGTQTVFLTGPAANKFLFTTDDNTLTNQQPRSIAMILGDRCMLQLRGDDHKRVRGALVSSFLKPEVLKTYVGKMDEEIKQHIEMYWRGQTNVTVFHFVDTEILDDLQLSRYGVVDITVGKYLIVLPLMKTLTFNIMCSLLFGLERGTQRGKLINGFQEMIGGMWSVPVNLPFTRFNRSMRASARVRSMIRDLINQKTMALQQGRSAPHDDLITCLISIQNQGNGESLSENEIIDNAMILMVAGYDTSSVLLTFLIRLLAKDPAVWAKVVCEQEEIAKGKSPADHLTWEDLSRMKYTWRVATETMRVTPPIFGGFRRVLKDVEFEGYLIPKGWQIFWAPHSTHMDERIFPEPSRFDPSRFENQRSVPPYSFVAFGGGPRICPGYEFARLETLVAIHYLVTQFKWKLCGEDDNFSRDPMPVPTQELPIQLEPKKI